MSVEIDFIRYRVLSFGLSTMAVVATLVLVYFSGLNLGVDFTGGVVCEVRLSSERDSIDKLREVLGGTVSVQSFRHGHSVLLKTQGKYWEKLKVVLADKNLHYDRVDYVGSHLSDKFVDNSILALFCSFLGVYLYLLFRFDHAFGLSGVLALVHDSIATLGFVVATGIEVNLPALTAILTIIGYSINDSVVIFDRMRTNLRGTHRMSFVDFIGHINRSINQTLSRTIYTSVTTLLAALALIIFNHGQIREFSLIISFGVIIGTYSSIFVSAPLYILFTNRSRFL